jgi:hypothetical protein
MKKAKSGSLPAEIRRFVGIALGGGKSDRTAVTVIDLYSKQGKAFVIDVFDSVGSQGDLSADEVLIEIIREQSSAVEIIAVDAPLSLPPCAMGCAKDCKSVANCRRPDVKWMRKLFLKAKSKNKKLKQFTPYTQRPVDAYYRYLFLDEDMFQDETLGSNRAPQAMRMQFLKSRLGQAPLIEVWPKLALRQVAPAFGLDVKEVSEYRDLEAGIDVREQIIESLVKRCDVFLYERDSKKIASSMIAFDSFICAWVALMVGLDRCMKFKKDIPIASGWVQIPEV